ncbi:hypothetical protein F8388_021620 [Cannabis sativa]|uniref:3-deoxy-8-phosphooctulonate synthase n=1 Tax=Cannabis sativa TaxID=3483 RepID=A0A7J6G615_CANSA|nr:hypothetical protein F8388_021620 [Cannabis sativa]KAF4386418.1 hypothetical protein G4B88_020238 [Cannabis sativa]
MEILGFMSCYDALRRVYKTVLYSPSHPNFFIFPFSHLRRFSGRFGLDFSVKSNFVFSGRSISQIHFSVKSNFIFSSISMSQIHLQTLLDSSPYNPERAEVLLFCSSQTMDSSSSALLYSHLKAADPFFLMAGPNVIESEDHIMRMAAHIKAVASNGKNAKVGLPLVFKSSFDKANRTSSKSFRGPGLNEGLKGSTCKILLLLLLAKRILEKVKLAYDLPIITDVHEASQCEAVGKVADIIQIPAFLCRQTDLLVAAAKTGKIINVKKGQFCAPSASDLFSHSFVMENSVEKIRLAGNSNVMVCERGTMFGYNDLIVDPRNLEWMREANCPVVADVTHSLQQPAGKKLDGGGVASGGLRELIPCIARTAVAVGVDGIFMEVHDDPLNAPVDGPTQWRVSKGKQPFNIDLTPYRD